MDQFRILQDQFKVDHREVCSTYQKVADETRVQYKLFVYLFLKQERGKSMVHFAHL